MGRGGIAGGARGARGNTEIPRGTNVFTVFTSDLFPGGLQNGDCQGSFSDGVKWSSV